MPRSGDALVNESAAAIGARPGPSVADSTTRTARLAWARIEQTLALVSALALGLFASSAAGDTAGVGEVLSPIALEDQHGVLHQIDDSTRVVLFSRDMDGGRLLKAALAEVPASALTERGAVYVSDISGMPRPVATLFALPGMRRRPYPMLLDRDGEATRVLPDVEVARRSCSSSDSGSRGSSTSLGRGRPRSTRPEDRRNRLNRSGSALDPSASAPSESPLVFTLHRAEDRFQTRTDWLDSRHAFSFAEHFDPARLGFGPLRVVNDDPHSTPLGLPRPTPIATEILPPDRLGLLTHEDSEGHRITLGPGHAQRMRAGRGIVHSEMNLDATRPLHLLQIWIEPAYSAASSPTTKNAFFTLAPGQVVVVASEDGAEGGLFDRPGRAGARAAARTG
ncbi:MAG: pirin family protein [Myxococcota bacterium]